MRQALAGSGATYISLIDSLCNSDTRTCQFLSNGAPIESDAFHLTPAGVELIIPAIVAAIEGGEASPAVSRL
jgi:hypothetical protein